jgi:5-methylcytosine-specific restriction protein A
MQGTPAYSQTRQARRAVLEPLYMDYFVFADPEHIKRERRKAQELRQSSWWKQRLGEGVCYYCTKKFSKELLTMDHLVPVARGGKTSKNKDCNSKKGHHMPVELTMSQMPEPTGENSEEI